MTRIAIRAYSHIEVSTNRWCSAVLHTPTVIDFVPRTFSQIKKWPPFYINDYSSCSTKAIRAYARLRRIWQSINVIQHVRTCSASGSGYCIIAKIFWRDLSLCIAYIIYFIFTEFFRILPEYYRLPGRFDSRTFGNTSHINKKKKTHLT